MAYKRQIAYFDYIQCGEKKGNGGFCKWEQRNGTHKMEISISGLQEKVSEKVKIFTKTGSELGNLQLHNGRATGVFSKKSVDGNWEWEFEKIRIPLSGERELVAEFPVEKNVQQPMEKEEEKNVQQSVEKVEERPLQTEIEEGEMPHAQQEERIPVCLWEWLEQTHERIRPFGTEEEYFRIAVDDIYRLKEECHVLRNNQFLLHGYYNYKYLILGKKEMGSEEYWLGVPGIYHEREKMAARMYGFEKFEGTKRRYGVGDLGYYLITAK